MTQIKGQNQRYNSAERHQIHSNHGGETSVDLMKSDFGNRATLKSDFKVIKILLFFILLSSIFYLPYSINASVISKTLTVPPNNLGLVGYWTLDGKNFLQNAADSSGQGNTGYLVLGASGNTSTTTAPGKLGQGYYFDGTDDYIKVPTVAALDLSGPLTVSAWIKSDTNLPTDKGIVTKWTTGSAGYMLYLSSGKVQGYIRSVNGQSNSTISAGVWYHIAYTWDGANIQMYVNGAADGTPTAATTITNDAGDVQIGTYNTRTQSVFKGVIDEARIYNRALSAGELLKLYNVGVGSRAAKTFTDRPQSALQSGITAWWTFDGKDMFSNVADVSGSGNTGNLSGTLGTTTTPGKLGQALVFDNGSKTTLVTSNTTIGNFGTGDFSISLWLQSTSTAFQWMMGKRTTCGNASFWDVYINSVAGKFGWELDQDAAATNYNNADSNITINNGKWHHIVLTRAGVTAFVYVDGVFDKSNSTAGTTNISNTASLQIGQVSVCAAPYFSGKLDNIIFYNKALSSTEVRKLYLSGWPVVAKTPSLSSNLTFGLVGWWTFDGKNMITNVADSSGQTKNGRLILGASGNTSTTTTPGPLGQAYSFDGINDYVSVGSVFNGVQTVAFWLKISTSTASQKILDLNGTATVSMSNGTLSANSFTTPSIYVDGAVSSSISDLGWHQVTITTGTGINASAVDLARITSTYLGGSLDDVRLYNRVLSTTEVSKLYTLGR